MLQDEDPLATPSAVPMRPVNMRPVNIRPMNQATQPGAIRIVSPQSLNRPRLNPNITIRSVPNSMGAINVQEGNVFSTVNNMQQIESLLISKDTHSHSY